MKKFIFFILFSSFTSVSAAPNLGIDFGIGIPFVSELGARLVVSDYLTIGAEYNSLSLSVGKEDKDNVKMALIAPLGIIQLHPFGGAFYLGAGLGRESLKISKEDSSGNEATVETRTMFTLYRLGWMWGKSDGGFWAGIDFSFLNPYGVKRFDLKVNGTTIEKSYKDDVKSAAKKYLQQGFPNITLLRVGYIF